ncbi:MAG: hypothetical protein Q7L07_12515, partial [Pseudohongiella sp.]|nr:hypothetical protein [Pseudohongiella sp.]
ARKGATVAADACAVVWLAGGATINFQYSPICLYITNIQCVEVFSCLSLARVLQYNGGLNLSRV